MGRLRIDTELGEGVGRKNGDWLEETQEAEEGGGCGCGCGGVVTCWSLHHTMIVN